MKPVPTLPRAKFTSGFLKMAALGPRRRDLLGARELLGAQELSIP